MAQQQLQLEDSIKKNNDTINKLTNTMDQLQQQETVIDKVEEKLTIVDENNKKSHEIVKVMGSTWR